MKIIVYFGFLYVMSNAALFGHDTVEIEVDAEAVRSIGGVTEFKREQFITIHSAPDELEYTDEDLQHLENDLEISYGRDGGTRTFWRQQTKEDPARPGFPSEESIKAYSEKRREELKGNPRNREESTKNLVVTTHPEYFYAKPDQDFAPFGPKSMEAAAEFSALFMKHFWTDAGRPKYFEVFNEPFVHKDSIGATIEGFSEQHVVVAKRLKEVVPDVLVGGYTAAWVEFDERDFAVWDSWQKKFMDIAGEHMDFLSYHIYDGINVVGKSRNRTGSNSEAIMDIIDTYSFIKWGKVKPLMISEYGLIPLPGNKHEAYSTRQDAKMLRSFNGMLATFMDHPDRLIKTVPFILGKAEWSYSDKGGTIEAPYPYLLWRKSGADYVKTEIHLFYKFWKGIKGSWRWSDASDPDIITHFLQDGKRLALIMTSLDEEDKIVSLAGLKNLNADKVVLRSLTTDGDVPILSEKTLLSIPEKLTLRKGEKAVLFIDTIDPVKQTKTITEHRCYSKTYLQDIKANQPVRFTFENVPEDVKNATLRMGISRLQEKSFMPKVLVNGKEFKPLNDWSGDDQAGRSTFYGVIEVPVTADAIKPETSIELVFPDEGGKVASAVLQVNKLN